MAAGIALAQTPAGKPADIEINPHALDALSNKTPSGSDIVKPPPEMAEKPDQPVVLPKVQDRDDPAFSLPYDASQHALPDISREKLASWAKVHLSNKTAVRIRVLGRTQTGVLEDDDATLTMDPVHLAVRTAYLYGLEVQKILIKAGMPRDRIMLVADMLGPDDTAGPRIDIFISQVMQ